jgi:hypothetical protein
MNHLEEQKKRDLSYLVNCFIHATSLVGPHYFQLPIAGQEEPIYRERVYCYELYHQLRCVLGDDFPYALNGEVDKSGHPIVRDEIGPRKPDFIVHVPGDMARNLTVIEVKPTTSTQAEFQDALRSLQGFVQRAGYFGAIALVYGWKDRNQVGWVEVFQETLRDVDAKPIVLLRHEGPGEAARIVC